VRILFFTDFFPPETNAAASRVFERALYWVRWGHEVTVVTSAPNFPQGKVYPGYRNRWYQIEDMEGIRVVRIKTYMASNEGKWRRGLDFVSFLFAGLPIGLLQKRPDVVAATSPNFFAGVCGCLVASLMRRPFLLEIGDLWPAFIVGLGEMQRSLVIRLLERIELYMYRKARRIVCLTQAFSDNLSARGIPGEKLKVIRNGVELGLFQQGAASLEMKERLNLAGDFLVGYYGTMGTAHGLETALEAADKLNGVRFLFVGGGAEAQMLKQKASEMGLRNVTFLPPQARTSMPELIRLCDVALVQLKPNSILATAVPSKLFEAMSMARPIVLAAPDGEAADILRQEGCGVRVPAGDPEALARTIAALRDDDETLDRLGRCGLEASSRHSREAQARRFLAVLEELQDSGPGVVINHAD